MGVDELLLGPGAVRAEQLDVQLPRGQHDLSLLLLDLVTVDVDVGEAVVAAEVLLLPERRQQRPVVPQPQVVDRRLVFVEDPAGELLLTGERARLDRVEVERRARRLHVIPDVGPLDGQLVRLDLEALHEARIEAADDDREHEPGAGREPEQPQRPEPGVQEQKPGRDEGDDGQDHVGRVLRIHVGVQRGLDVAVPPASRVRQLRDVELVAGGDDDQEERADDREVPPDGAERWNCQRSARAAYAASVNTPTMISVVEAQPRTKRQKGRSKT